MPTLFSRREFTRGVAAVAALPFAKSFPWLPDSQSPFRISVINDEISQDFEHACEIAAHEFGMKWIELRSMWKKNIVSLDQNEVTEARRILDRFQLKVTDIASPLFKVDWPGAPKSKFSEATSFGANFSLQQQDEVLDRAIAMAKSFSTDRVRCFDFWRLEDQAPYRAAINDKLLQAANKCGEHGITLVLENEPACNTATGAEAAKVLAAVKSPHLMLNWDPGNAATLGEVPYPDGYNLLPKDRIGHCHCKDAVRNAKGYEWAPMGGGIIDWTGQFKALKRDGYHFAVSLETHWSGGGTPEKSTRTSWAGMKKELQDAQAI
ncbi:MAG TPA: sugar phosphate isomerase/epimerase family protein [Candidatus Sulfotelmatobacter sp.]|nr:sugar phosphate isomerase/epimerase family protein [Candidatus Sulfotelmatobacter sp.]